MRIGSARARALVKLVRELREPRCGPSVTLAVNRISGSLRHAWATRALSGRTRELPWLVSSRRWRDDRPGVSSPTAATRMTTLWYWQALGCHPEPLKEMAGQGVPAPPVNAGRRAARCLLAGRVMTPGRVSRGA
jgi:hypothetical protein